MASISSRKDRDGNIIGWQIIVRRKGHPSQTKTFRSRRDAEVWGRQVENEMDRGIWRDRSQSENTTLKECLRRYVAEIIPTKKGDGRREIGFANQWMERPIAGRFMAAIRGSDVADTIREMESEGKSPNTIRLHLALLSHLFAVAKIEWDMEALDNPVQAVRKPKLPQGRDRRLVGDEETRLLAACQIINQELRNIVLFAIETAMRQGEIMGMTWDKVDLKRQTVTLEDTKNGDKRIVPLTTRATQILRDLPRNLDGKVWAYTDDGMRTSYKRAVKKAGIEGMTFHDLRHEATSRLFEKGLGLMQVAAITGHKNVQMLKRYTHLKPEDLVELLR